MVSDYVDEQIGKMKKIQDNFISHIKEFKALKEYCKVNKEAARKIAKKYDKIAMVKPQKPFM